MKDHQHEVFGHTKRSKRAKDSRICMYITKEQVRGSRVKVSAATSPRTAALSPTFFLSKAWGTHQLLQQTGLCGISYSSAPCPWEWSKPQQSICTMQHIFQFSDDICFQIMSAEEEIILFLFKVIFFNVISITGRLMSSICCLSCKFCQSQRCLAAPNSST